MQELSIEEKAKAYDEAIKVLHKYDGANIMFSQSLKEEMFPELKESEEDNVDEKVRKALIKLVTNHASMDLFIEYDIHLYEALSWLEKQGEKKPNSEQKPIVKVEPKFKVGDIVKRSDDGLEAIVTKVYGDGTITVKCEDWEDTCLETGWEPVKQQSVLDIITPEESLGINSEEYNEIVDECIYGDDKSAWGEEVEDNIEWLIGYLEYQIMSGTITEERKNCLNAISMLKSLRPQNNITDEELAQAKKDAYNDALDKIEYHSGEPTFDDGWSAAIWFLKKRNTAPQNTWKPSDVQMKTFEYYIDADICNKDKEILFGLYADLKKLRKE